MKNTTLIIEKYNDTMSSGSYQMTRFLQTVDVIVIDAEKCLFWHGLSVIKVSSAIYLKLLTETRSWGSKS